MSKQNTAIICLSPYSGGMEIDAIRLAKKLSPHAKILMLAREGYFIASQQNDYVGYNNIVLETIQFQSSLSFNLIFKAREIIKHHGVKNVIFFGASELKSLYFAFLGMEINLIVRHGTTKSRPKKDWFHRLIYSNVNYHVSICKHLLENVRFIIPFGKNTQEMLIYSSIETKPFVKENHTCPTLIHIGRIAEGKGQTDALMACGILYESNIDFLFYIVGGFDKEYETTFMEFYNTLPYKENIVLVGFTKEVTSYLAKSDIFLFPSYGEGLSNAFLEALACGLSCIAYDNTSFPELKDLGFDFSMVKNRDITQLKKELLNTATHLEQKKEQLKNNNNVIQKKFSLKEQTTKYLQILQ